MNKLFLIKSLIKRIDHGKELMKEFPQYRQEYLEETLDYSKILYQLMRESFIP